MSDKIFGEMGKSTLLYKVAFSHFPLHPHTALRTLTNNDMRTAILFTLIAFASALTEPKCNQSKTLSVCASDESNAFVTCKTRIGPVRTDCETSNSYCYEYIDKSDGYVKAYCKPKVVEPKCINGAQSVCASDESETVVYCNAAVGAIRSPCLDSSFYCYEYIDTDKTVKAYCKKHG
jgi:hypothetical protein